MFLLEISRIVSEVRLQGFPADLVSAIEARLISFVISDSPAADMTITMTAAADDKLTSGLEYGVSADVYSFKGRGMRGYIRGSLAGGDLIPDINIAESFIRIVYSVLAVRNGGLLMHAAGFRGDIYTGPAGSGKTTSVRHKKNILGDDIIALKEESGGWYAYSTPFSGELGDAIRQRKEAVKSLYLLDMEKRPAAEHEVYSGIMRNAVYFFNDDFGIKKIDECAASLSRRVPGYGYKNI